ncbi:MAG: Maf family protein, partial [Oscillospiraceae bacterium]
SDEVVKTGLNPSEVVRDLAMQKAKNIEKRLNDDEIIIAADTIVVLDDELLGKPKDRENAVEILTKLSGNTHCVFTGIAVIDTKTNQIINDFEKTFVKFRDISISEIEKYIESGEPMDKAGAYGIQNLGALFVEKIDGDYFNVVGLPLCKLGKILMDKFDVKVL